MAEGFDILVMTAAWPRALTLLWHISYGISVMAWPRALTLLWPFWLVPSTGLDLVFVEQLGRMFATNCERRFLFEFEDLFDRGELLGPISVGTNL